MAPGTNYYHRLSGEDARALRAGPIGEFRTLGGAAGEVSFVAVAGMDRFAFLATTWGTDRASGFPALATIVGPAPDSFISTGDSVYYDTPHFVRADTLLKMRAMWHRQFATPRFRDLFLAVPTYWL